MAIKISGLISGLDTDAIVQELVSAYSTKKDNIVKSQTKLSWKQDTWKELNTKIYNLYSKTLSDMRFTTAHNKKSTSVSDETKATVIASSDTVNGTQTLEVKKLAKAGYLTGEKLQIGDGTTKVSGTTSLSELGLNLPTSINVTIGGEIKLVNLNTDTTVNGLVTSLKEAGVNASFDSVNQRLFISSKSSGLDGEFSLSSGSANGTAALESLGLTSAGAVKINGEDAQIVLNGASFTSSSNSITVNGLTINAKEVTEGKISITTETDTQAIYDTIKNFFKEYNTLVNEMDSLYNASSAKGYQPLTDEEKESMSETEIEKWEEKIKDSLMRRDGTLNSVSTVMKTAMSKTYEVNNNTYSLSTFGINTLSYFVAADNEKSAYHIDGDGDDSSTSGKADKLMTAIATDPDGVASFFKQLATGLYNDLDSKMKTTRLSSAYSVYNDKQLSSDYEAYEDQIEKWEEKIADMEKYYYDKFTTMETALSKLQSQTSALSNLLGG